MLAELKRYFTLKGWYCGTHDFIKIKLQGGFEAFSGKASETWEYRWVIEIPENPELKIPEIIIKGGRFETIDEIAKKVLDKLNTQNNG